jgi:hypothetical protein
MYIVCVTEPDDEYQYWRKYNTMKEARAYAKEALQGLIDDSELAVYPDGVEPVYIAKVKRLTTLVNEASIHEEKVKSYTTKS